MIISICLTKKKKNIQLYVKKKTKQEIAINKHEQIYTDVFLFYLGISRNRCTVGKKKYK